MCDVTALERCSELHLLHLKFNLLIIAVVYAVIRE